MMEVRSVFRFGRCLFVGPIFMFYVCIGIAGQSIPGFVSIDCGAASAYSDAVTELPWEGDSQYISTGTNGNVAVAPSSTDANLEALQTFRYFPDRRNKHCYELPTRRNTSVLLRAMFFHGSSPELPLPLKFSAAVNGSVLFTLILDDDTSVNDIWEGIMFSPGSLLHFCLMPETGVPFISSLEVRALDQDNTMYNSEGENIGRILVNTFRINCGASDGTPTVRYPDDQFDRLWFTPGDWAPTFDALTGTASVTVPANSYYVPLKVLQDAWRSAEPNSTLQFNFSLDSTQVYMALYFDELDPDATAGAREIEILMNDNFFSFNVSDYARVIYYSNWTLPSMVANVTLTGRGSGLGPIVNAIEVYSVDSFNDSATAPEDVDALASLKESFNLTDWQGDPCYPVPWDWLGCSARSPARVEKLLLSNMGIEASIPPSIVDLDGLKQIYLDNNSLYGTIPDSLASLRSLTALYLSNNNLSGEIPPRLLSELGANFDYDGNELLGASPPSSSNSTEPTPKKSSNTGAIVGGVVGAFGGLIAIGVLIWYIRFKKSTKPPPNQGNSKVELATPGKPTASITAWSSPEVKVDSASAESLPSTVSLHKNSTEFMNVSYAEVKAATNNFSKKIGQGSYGTVFHGWFKNREVAVKHNNLKSDQGRAEFLTEVDILTRVHHRNLVSLVGYCNEGELLILIYEYEDNGTVREWIHAVDGDETKTTLNWNQRLQIAVDGARGLEYLHKGCDPTIIHRDVKSSNILLDSTMTAKVADFGLSKATSGYNTVGYSTGVKGTPGYLDPEYHHLGRLTHKSDVYSYGVVLAELITGLLPFSVQTGSSPVILVDRVRKLVERNDIEALADPKLGGAFNSESMWRLADITLSCIDPVGARRPDFSQVVIGINEALQLEKTFTLHSPIALAPFTLISNTHNRYQNLP